MGIFRDLTKERFGRLVVIKRMPNDTKNKKVMWQCKCDCSEEGKEVLVTVVAQSLTRGLTTSCGCRQKEFAKASIIKFNGKYHGQADTRLYRTWEGIKKRCNNPHEQAYKYYGGKGIKMCEEWELDFMSFYKWAMKNGYSDTLTINRKDGNKNYCPENCEWADKEVQSICQGMRKDNTSGVKGVCWEKLVGKWKVQIQAERKNRVIGYYEDFDEAVEVRKKAEEFYHKPLIERGIPFTLVSTNN